MRIPPYLAAGVLCLGLVTSASAVPAGLGDFAWRCPLTGTMKTGGLYRIEIPEEVMNRSRSFPADLRIVDEKDAEWPFFLWAPSTREEILERRTTRLPGTTSLDPAHHVTQELRVVVANDDVQPPHDRIALVTSGSDFIRKVEIEGSEDGRDWKPLGSGYLVEKSADVPMQNRTIRYPASTLPFLRMVISPDVASDTEHFELLSATVGYRVPPVAEPQRIPLRRIDAPAAKPPFGVQIVEVDTGSNNRPVERLHLRASSPRYMRPVRVLGRETSTNGWRWIADGGIHRLGTDVRDVIDLHGATVRYLRAELYQYDEKPLELDIQAEVAPQYLVFEAGAGTRPMFYYGAERPVLPHYDLSRRVREDIVPKLPAIGLGPKAANPGRIATGLRTYSRALAYVGVLIALAFGLVALLNWWRRRA